MTKHWCGPEDPTSAFLEFLAGQPLLESLKFYMFHFPASTAYPIGVPVEMPQLEVMVAECLQSTPSETSQAFTSILQSIKAPKLRSLAMIMPFVEESEWESLLPHFNDYEGVRKLQIAANCNARRHDDTNISSFSPFQLTYRRFPNLEHLDIISDNVTLFCTAPHGCTDIDPPPLQSLKIAANPKFTPESLLNIIQYLMRGQQWDRFERLEIRGCKHLQDQDGWLEPLPKCQLLVRRDGNEYGCISSSTYFEVVFDHEGEAQRATSLR
jgi:hypothetical protein